MPEPDLPPLVITDAMMATALERLPVLPRESVEELAATYSMRHDEVCIPVPNFRNARFGQCQSLPFHVPFAASLTVGERH